MKTINIGENSIKVKQEFLTGGQVSNLVAESIRIYKNGGLFDDYNFNPIDMEMNFYAGLFYLTLEDFDISDIEKFEEYFAMGIHEILLEEVKNAKLAYDLMWKTAKEIGNSVGLILNKIKTFLDSLPETSDLRELANKLPDEWDEVTNKYNKIIGKELSEGDKE